MPVDDKLKAFLIRRIDYFQSTERSDVQGDLSDRDIADTLEELAATHYGEVNYR